MTNRLSTNLKNKARYFAGEITKLAKEFAPAHLRKSGIITSHIEERGEGTFVIRTTANAPDAHAWEFGSGLHAKRGTKKKYPITGKPFLVFPWEIANANPERFHFTKEGKVVLHQVMHPGIEAANDGKGYIGPAHREMRKVIKENLLQSVDDAVHIELRRAFTVKSK